MTLPLLLTTKEAAQALRLKPKTLTNMRARGEGPPYLVTPAGSVRYELGAIAAALMKGNKGFNFDGFATVLGRCKSLNREQRREVMEAVRTWLSAKSAN